MYSCKLIFRNSLFSSVYKLLCPGWNLGGLYCAQMGLKNKTKFLIIVLGCWNSVSPSPCFSWFCNLSFLLFYFKIDFYLRSVNLISLEIFRTGNWGQREVFLDYNQSWSTKQSRSLVDYEVGRCLSVTQDSNLDGLDPKVRRLLPTIFCFPGHLFAFTLFCLKQFSPDNDFQNLIYLWCFKCFNE